MNNYSQADMAFKKLIDSMKQNGSVFTSTEALLKEINAIIDQNGADEEEQLYIHIFQSEERPQRTAKGNSQFAECAG